MKKLYLAIVSIILVASAWGQSFTSQNGTFQISGPYDGPNIHGEVTITNVSGQALDLICRISVTGSNITAGHTKWFCFGPNCYPPNVTVSLATSINAGDTALLSAYCAPNDSEGVSVIHYEIYDANGNSDTISFDFTYFFTYAGIDEFSSASNNLNVYSNPAKEHVNVSFELKKPANVNISVSDIFGKVLYSENFSENQGMNFETIDVNGFPKGIYLLNIRTAQSTSTAKIAVE